MPAPEKDEVASVRGLAKDEDDFTKFRDLTDAIVERFHEAHRRELPALVSLAERVETVHRDSADAPAGLADLLQAFAADLGRHIALENDVLFSRFAP